VKPIMSTATTPAVLIVKREWRLTFLFLFLMLPSFLLSAAWRCALVD
jgi:hypothetical protein